MWNFASKTTLNTLATTTTWNTVVSCIDHVMIFVILGRVFKGCCILYVFQIWDLLWEFSYPMQCITHLIIFRSSFLSSWKSGRNIIPLFLPQAYFSHWWEQRELLFDSNHSHVVREALDYRDCVWLPLASSAVQTDNSFQTCPVDFVVVFLKAFTFTGLYLIFSAPNVLERSALGRGLQT